MMDVGRLVKINLSCRVTHLLTGDWVKPSISATGAPFMYGSSGANQTSGSHTLGQLARSRNPLLFHLKHLSDPVNDLVKVIFLKI